MSLGPQLLIFRVFFQKWDIFWVCFFFVAVVVIFRKKVRPFFIPCSLSHPWHLAQLWGLLSGALVGSSPVAEQNPPASLLHISQCWHHTLWSQGHTHSWTREFRQSRGCLATGGWRDNHLPVLQGPIPAVTTAEPSGRRRACQRNTHVLHFNSWWLNSECSKLEFPQESNITRMKWLKPGTGQKGSSFPEKRFHTVLVAYHITL